MQPNSEPTAADVAMVAEALGQPQAPAPQPQAPAPVAQEQQPQMQPAPVTPQPSPTSQAPSDPFASLFAQPTEPVAPVAPQPQQPTQPTTPQPQQPTEPTQPAPQAPAPVAPVAPAQPAVDDYQTYDEYMAQVLANVPQAPATPDPEKIDPNDPAAIKGFFDDLITTVKDQVRSESSRSSALQNAERQLWDASFDKFPTLKANKPVRDMVHNIRMGYFQRGIAITPTQAAEKLLESLGSSYQQGVADSAVVTTYENVQPQGGGTGAPVETSLDRQNVLTAIQDGGEQALAAYLDGEVKAGRM